MNKRRVHVLLLTFLCCLVLFSAVSADMFSDNYGISWDARWGGGGFTNSANYAVNGTVGQGIIGWIESANYGVGTGYWYGTFTQYNIYLPLVLQNAS